MTATDVLKGLLAHLVALPAAILLAILEHTKGVADEALAIIKDVQK